MSRKAREFQRKYGLTDLDDKDIEILDMILTDLAGTGGLMGQINSIGFKPAEMQTVNAL